MVTEADGLVALNTRIPVQLHTHLRVLSARERTPLQRLVTRLLWEGINHERENRVPEMSGDEEEALIWPE
jgi:hypothetical protein